MWSVTQLIRGQYNMVSNVVGIYGWVCGQHVVSMEITNYPYQQLNLFTINSVDTLYCASDKGNTCTLRAT